MAEFEWPEPQPVIYRLYYQDDGTPICYSMEDQPGNYIDVDPMTFAKASMNVRVVNGKIKDLSRVTSTTKLVPSENGTACHVNDVTIVVDPTEPHTKWSNKNYESD